MSILDNSVFELGTAYNPDKFVKFINILEPSYYIVPDVLGNSAATINAFIEFQKKYDTIINRDCKPIGVCAGSTYEDLMMCYDFMHMNCSKIAIPYDSPAFSKTHNLTELAEGRQQFIKNLYKKYGTVCKPLHLLGCSNPIIEANILRESDCKLIVDSIDTSAPVMLALNGIDINTTNDSNYVKPKTLMADIIGANAPDIDTTLLIAGNIVSFRKALNG
jgi:hypothetical protein